MHLRHVYEPSDKQKEQYPADTAKFRQDEFVHAADADGVTIAVFDWAKNFVGRSEFVDADSAADRGLPVDTPLNGGEIGSTVAKRVVAENPALTGYPLIERINYALRSKCQELGIVPSGLTSDDEIVAYMAEHRPELLTGYVAHVRVTPEATILTAIGDVYCAIDGVLRAGGEKWVDVRMMQLVREEAAKGTDFQKAYRAIAVPMIAEQFRYQNRPGSGEFYYPAIDGTETPKDGVTVLEFPTRDVHRVLLYSDGLRPKTEGVVNVIEDLAVVDRVFNERTAIELTLAGNWDALDVEEGRIV